MFEMESRGELVEKIEDLVNRKRYTELRDLLLPLEPADIAILADDLDDEKTLPLLFRLLPKEQAAEVFVELESDQQELLIRGFSNTELKEVLDELYLDDTVDIVIGKTGTVGTHGRLTQETLRLYTARVRLLINAFFNIPFGISDFDVTGMGCNSGKRVDINCWGNSRTLDEEIRHWSPSLPSLRTFRLFFAVQKKLVVR